jgi:hypothetical protein
VLQEIVPSFQSNSEAVILHSKGPSAVFRDPRNLYHGSEASLQLVSIFDPPRKADFDFPFVPDAAGCLTPDRRSRAGGRRPVRPPSDLRSRSRSLEETGCQGLAVSSPPPRVLRCENGTFPRAATGRVYSLWLASGRLDAPRSHSKPRYEPMLGFTRGWCRPGMAGTRIRFPAPAPPQGIKWTTTCLPAMIFVCIRTVSVWMEGSSTSPIRT